MKYVRHYEQKTIKATTAEEFDCLMNDVYARASDSGKDPEVHFFDSMGFCASVKYYVSINIPENLAEEYSLRGIHKTCKECPYMERPKDKRLKHALCTFNESETYFDCPCCDIFYKEFMEAKDGTN